MALYKVIARWTGFSGAPGYSVFHFDTPVEANAAGAQDAADAVRAFFDGFRSYLPTAVKIDIETGVSVVEETNGEMQTVITINKPASVAGLNGGAFASSTGACVVWETTGVRNGRRVKGRTFLVPLSVGAYDTDGTLIAQALTEIQTAAAALVASATAFHTWSRPSGPGATDGQSFQITGARINDKAAVLRSRRD